MSALERVRKEHEKLVGTDSGWHELIHPRWGTSHPVHIREDGEIYVPEEDQFTVEELAVFDARGNLRQLAPADSRALEALVKVLELHRENEPDEHASSYQDGVYLGLERFCAGCSDLSNGEYGVAWPCPTVRAVEAVFGSD